MKQDARHLARLHAVQFLFQADYNDIGEEVDQALADFWEGLELPGKLARKCEALARGVMDQMDPIDDQLEALLDNWRIDRLGGVERNVLRLALYELNHKPEVPPVVAVNEAVQVARELSDDKGGAFINGILQKVLQELDRPLRKGQRSEGGSRG